MAWLVKIDTRANAVISVASPAAVILLKLIAWSERDTSLRRKDALDIAYIVQNYHRIPSVSDRLYEAGFMEASDWDREQASAMLLGAEIDQVLRPETRSYLKTHFIDKSTMREGLIRDMDARNARAWLEGILLAAVNDAPQQ